jgi:hypothetical protein
LRTVAMHRASAAPSVPQGRSPSRTAPSNHCRDAVTAALLKRASALRAGSASSPHARTPSVKGALGRVCRSRRIRGSGGRIDRRATPGIGRRRS